MVKVDKKYNKHLRMKNKKICKKYPWLIPRNVYTGEIYWDHKYDFTELDAMPKGWRKAFGDIWCEEIDQALRKDNYRDKFQIEQMKEKFGELRCYVNGYPPNVKDVINAFEVISRHVCISCGKLDAHVIDDYGWYLPLCEKCYNGQKRKPSISYSDRLEEEGISADEPMPTTYTIKQYTPKTDELKEITYDISDIVTKIRYKNRKRFKNEQKVT